MFTLRGNHINYPDYFGTATSDVLTTKLLLNDMVPTPNAQFMTLDIKKLSQYTNGDILEFETEVGAVSRG